MSHGEILAEIAVIGWVNGNGGKSSSQGDQKGRRSKHPLIPGSDDVINANDIISPSKTYIRRYKTVKFHTKQSEAKGRGSILHPQVIGIDELGKMSIDRVG